MEKISYKEKALSLNGNLICRKIGSRFEVVDGDKQIATSNNQSNAWLFAYGEIAKSVKFRTV